MVHRGRTTRTVWRPLTIQPPRQAAPDRPPKPERMHQTLVARQIPVKTSNQFSLAIRSRARVRMVAIERSQAARIGASPNRLKLRRVELA